MFCLTQTIVFIACYYYNTVLRKKRLTKTLKEMLIRKKFANSSLAFRFWHEL